MLEVKETAEVVGVRRVQVVTEAKRSPGSQKLTVVSQVLVFDQDGRFVGTADRTEKTVAINEGVSM